MTHVMKVGYGYWDVTSYPYGGCFRRCQTAFGVTLVPDRCGSKPSEVVVQCPGDKGPRILVVDKSALVSLEAE